MNQIFLPKTLDELWSVLNDYPDAALMAGGTDLLVQRRAGLKPVKNLICLERLSELQGISLEKNIMSIGACVTHRACLDSDMIQHHAPVLTRALTHLGGPQIRNMGTLGGNICTASPAGDSLPALHVLGAKILLLSRNTQRTLSMEQFITGPGRTAMKPGEILAQVHIPSDQGFQIHHFEKIGQRKALAIAMVSLAAMIKTGQRGIIQEARLALGSVGPTVIRPKEAEDALVGRTLSISALRHAAGLISKAVNPISDIRATAEYRREAAGNLMLRLSLIPAKK